MVTGASTANLSIVLVDARQGVIEQTRRHTYLAALLGIPHLVIAVNKMDLVDWSEDRFLEIREAVEAFLPKLDIFKDVKFVPMSALHGDNVVEFSRNTPWYCGPTLLGHLETVHIASDWNLSAFRFPVQWVNRPHKAEHHDFRGYSGQIAGGVVRVGMPVHVLPSGLKSAITQIWTYNGPVEEAFCPQSVTLQIGHDIDISRGDILVGMDKLPGRASELEADVCWMQPRPLQPGRKYHLKHNTHNLRAVVTGIEHKINFTTLEPDPSVAELGLNDIGKIRFKTTRPLVYDGYATNRLTGSFILIEEGTNQTAGAGMLHPPAQPIRDFEEDFTI
jgi:bifunctional enzyme CysN/CysC/sulfate adenylyltransferase subunit 1